MHATYPMITTLALCGAFAASAALAQTAPTPATPPQSTTPQQPVPPTTPPPPDPALPPTAASTGLPPGNRTLQQQQQNLHNDVERRSDDSIRHNGYRPGAPTDTSGHPASASSSY